MTDENNDKYRLVSGNHRSARTDERLEVGDTFVPTTAELTAFGDRFARVDDGAHTSDEPDSDTDDSLVGPGDTEAEPPSEAEVREAKTDVPQEYIVDGEFDSEGFIDQHWTQAQQGILSGQYDTVLDEIEAAEQARGDDDTGRSSIMKAVEQRRE